MENGRPCFSPFGLVFKLAHILGPQPLEGSESLILAKL